MAVAIPVSAPARAQNEQSVDAILRCESKHQIFGEDLKKGVLTKLREELHVRTELGSLLKWLKEAGTFDDTVAYFDGPMLSTKSARKTALVRLYGAEQNDLDKLYESIWRVQYGSSSESIAVVRDSDYAILGIRQPQIADMHYEKIKADELLGSMRETIDSFIAANAARAKCLAEELPMRVSGMPIPKR